MNIFRLYGVKFPEFASLRGGGIQVIYLQNTLLDNVVAVPTLHQYQAVLHLSMSAGSQS